MKGHQMREEIKKVLEDICDNVAILIADKKGELVDIDSYVQKIMFIAGMEYMQDKLAYQQRILKSIEKIK